MTERIEETQSEQRLILMHWLSLCSSVQPTKLSFDYRSGKCSIIGTTSPEHFEQMVERVNTLMRELLKFDYEPTAEIKNIVATAELDSLPSLETIAIGLGLEQTEYEPEQFPAVIYRPPQFIVTLLIFSTGKVIVGGTTDREEAQSAPSARCR